jgi:hypothetical protein
MSRAKPLPHPQEKGRKTNASLGAPQTGSKKRSALRSRHSKRNEGKNGKKGVEKERVSLSKKQKGLRGFSPAKKRERKKERGGEEKKKRETRK